MSNLKEALALFDSEMEFVRLQSEQALKDHGASEEELERFRQTELLELNVEILRHRAALIRMYCDDDAPDGALH